jgi:hypothetical protein
MDAPFDCPDEVLNALGRSLEASDSRSLREPPSPSTLDSDAGSWTVDILRMLENLLLNSNNYKEQQRKHVFMLSYQLNFFKLPLIILSALNSVFSIGLSAFIEQQTVSVLNCLISLMITVIGSVELYLAIQKKLETRLQSFHHFESLCNKIAATLRLDAVNRTGTGPAFLQEILNEYKAGLDAVLLNKTPWADFLIEGSMKVPRAV